MPSCRITLQGVRKANHLTWAGSFRHREPQSCN